MTYWKGETHHIIQAMKATGNRPGIIARWKEDVAAWAQMNRTDPNAAAVNAWLPLWQPRPFYTADELAPLWPALAIATGFTERWPAVLKSARRLAHELDYYGLPRLNYFRHYFICERLHYWRGASKEQIVQEMQHAFG
jgi:hypothetical protein